MCKCGKRALTFGLVCCGFLYGANPPAAAVGHVLTMGSSAGSTVTMGKVVAQYPVPNMVTGAALTSPVALPRAGMHEPDKWSG
jgi:hypothetical protein